MPSKADVEAQAKLKLEARARCRTDKLYLATEILGYDFCEDVHQELFDQFIYYDQTKPWAEQSAIVKRMILWPRGHFKSTAVVVEIIQAILNFPDIRVLIMQGSLKTTKNLLKEIASHFTGEANRSKLVELFPEFCGSKKALEFNSLSFTTPARQRKQLQQATVTCASPKATKTGQHYDIGFFDDLVNDQNYRSTPQLQKTREDFAMCMPLLDPPFYAVVTGTRYSFEPELYAIILRAESDKPEGKKEWLISVKNCWTDDGQCVRFPKRATKDGLRTVGFTREELLAIQVNDPQMFSGQYLNRPIQASSNLFTDEKMMGAVIAAADAPSLSQAILFVDLASTTEFYSDDSVILAMKTDHIGRMFVVDGVGDQWSPSSLALNVIAMALKHRPLRIMFEKTAPCLYFVEYLRTVCRDKGIQLPIDFITVDTQVDAKNVRVCATEGYIRTKRLLFFAGLACWDKLVTQIKRFPKPNKSGHDDYPDTMAIGVRFLTGQVTPTIPLSQTANSFLKAIEIHEQQAAVRNQFLAEQTPAHYEGMGDSFDD